jgi:ABC-2 type transport system ATP-binding protein
MAHASAIRAEGVHKSYGKTHALAGLDLVAEEGSVLSILGPNGAGKTTAVRILTTLLKPDRGRAEVAGLDVVKHASRVRARIGLAGQYAAVDELLTGYENLKMFATTARTHHPRPDHHRRGGDRSRRYARDARRHALRRVSCHVSPSRPGCVPY